MNTAVSSSYVDEFRAFYKSAQEKKLLLDLHGASIVECMDALIETRLKRYPNYAASYLTTRKTLNQMQFLLGGQPIKTNVVNRYSL